MNKTLYLKDEDGPIWDKARQHAGDKLSPILVDALKKYIAYKESEAKGFERIEVRYQDSENNFKPTAKAFYGRWIITPEEPHEVVQHEDRYNKQHALAVTAKNNVVIYTWYIDDDDKTCFQYSFNIFPSFDEAFAINEYNSVARRAYEVIGVPVEELDI